MSIYIAYRYDTKLLLFFELTACNILRIATERRLIQSVHVRSGLGQQLAGQIPGQVGVQEGLHVQQRVARLATVVCMGVVSGSS